MLQFDPYLTVMSSFGATAFQHKADVSIGRKLKWLKFLGLTVQFRPGHQEYQGPDSGQALYPFGLPSQKGSP
jgi:hypothetical protein